MSTEAAEAPIALVTGAARRVGRAVAMGLAREGYGIVVHYGGSAGAASDTAKEIRDLGVPALTAQADLEDPAAIAALFGQIGSRFGRLDVLVNSAATFRKEALRALDAASWDAVLAVNLRAPMLCMRRAAELMDRRGPDARAGAVVNLVDLSGQVPWPGYVAHGVSKAGLAHLTRIGARELGPTVRVNAVVPGAILPPPGMSADAPAWLEKGRRLPVGRVGDPSHVADAVAFLVRNDFVTGELVHVDGGEQLLGPFDHG